MSLHVCLCIDFTVFKKYIFLDMAENGFFFSRIGIWEKNMYISQP